MDLKELIAEAKRISEIRCSDGYCKFAGPIKSMHTNGGCHCSVSDSTSRASTRDDMLYMVNLLGLIALAFESEKKR